MAGEPRREAGSNPPTPASGGAPSLSKGGGKGEWVGARLGLPTDREAGTGAKLNKIYTKFIFFRVFPDESTVEVVYSFPARTMGSATLHYPACGGTKGAG